MDIQPYIQLGLAGVALWLMYQITMKILTKVSVVIDGLSASIDKNTVATNELFTYVKVRNGTLERIVQANPEVRDAAKRTLGSAL